MAIDICQLPMEILLEVFKRVPRQSGLADCVLVNSTFQKAADPSLYRDISLDFLRGSGSTLNFPALKTLDKRVHLRGYVQAVDLCVHEPQTAYYLDSVSPADVPWVQSLARLSTVTAATLRRLTSVGGVSEIISSMLVVGLRNCNALTELNLLYTIERASLVPFTTFTNLRSITFAKLEPPVLDFVAESDSWMASATSLSFLSTAGFSHEIASNMLAVPLQLETLVLGPGQSINKGFLSGILGGIPRLRCLDIFYDNFLHGIYTGNSVIAQALEAPQLSFLEELVVRHQGVSLPSQFNDLIAWIRILIESAPLTHLSLIADDSKEFTGVASANNLIALAIGKLDSLVFLNIPFIHLRHQHLLALFRTLRLRVLNFRVHDSVLFGLVEDAVEEKLVLPRDLIALYLKSSRQYSSVSSIVNTWISSSDTDGKMVRPNPLRRVAKNYRASKDWQAIWTADPTSSRGGLDALVDEGTTWCDRKPYHR